MSTLTERLDEVEHRVTEIEVSSARLDERLNSLVKATNNLKWAIYCITFVCVLALVYGAIGRDGFYAVRDAATSVSTISNNGGAK